MTIPAEIATCLASVAQFGLRDALDDAVYIPTFMAAIQETLAHALGRVHCRGISANLRQRYRRLAIYVILRSIIVCQCHQSGR